MNILPESTYLGILKITEIYEYFDIPCLFSCRNNSGQIFIAVWIDESEDHNDWLYVPVSEIRFQEITSGKIDLRNTFLNSEDNFVFKITVNKKDNKSNLETIICSQISEEWLPEANEFIESKAQASSKKIKESLRQKAIALRREILRITLEFRDTIQNEAPLKEWGNILVALQELFEAIGQFKKGSPTANGIIPQEIKNEARFNVIGVSSGSFVTEIAASEIGNLFNESLANEIIEEFIQVINQSDNQEELTKIIKKLKLRAAHKYRDFLNELQTARTQFRIDWESPMPNKGSSGFLDENTIINAISIINQLESDAPRIINMIGTLIGGNKRTKKFEILDSEEETYKGKISENVINSSISLILDRQYTFTLEETKKIKPTTDEIFFEYELISLNSLGND